MSDCLPPDELKRFLAGALAPEREAAVAAHFDQCEVCQRMADETVDWGPVDACRSAASCSDESADIDGKSEAVVATLLKLAETASEPTVSAGSLVQFPEKIGSYRILRLLAQGSTGAVYLAAHPDQDGTAAELTDVVAVKVLAPECVSRPLHRKRFERERNSLAGLPPHPNVVRVLDSCLTDENRFLVMEYAGGDNLWQLVTTQPLVSIEKACQLALQAAEGLSHVHTHGLTHRDIKPSNLIVDSEGRLKIVDFGIVHHAEVEQLESRLTEKNALIGTADFMAPEQALDVHSVGPQADIYSLGCTLAWLLTGSLLFERKSVSETLMAHRRTPPPSLRERRSDIPPKLDALFQKMVAKEPDDRPASMDQVIGEIQSVLADLTTSESVQGTAGRVQETELEPVERTALGRTDVRLAVFVAVLVVVAAAFFALR